LVDLAAAWEARPRTYSRVVWALVLALDALPWPWGEEILARCFVARAFVRTARLRRALAWAGAQPGAGRRRWSLARSLCFHHGRFVARSALVGMRDPETLRRHVAARGEEHLAAAGAGAILLGFHLGPAQSYLALRVLSHMDGRVQVVTIHPPLPASLSDPALDLEACRRALGELLGEHARRFPEQCYSLAFWLPPEEPPRRPGSP